jgi:hypothetical protein
VDVQSLAAGGLDERGQAEFVCQQFPQPQRGYAGVAKMIRIRRVQVEDQLIRVVEPVEPAEEDV